MSKEKDFANVGEMSASFNDWSLAAVSTANATNTNALIWQARAQMAIAQQLTLISKHLGKIVANAEERSNSRT